MSDAATAPIVDLDREIQASPDTVWEILTTPELFSVWMEGQVRFEPQPGAAFRAEFPQFQIVLAGEIVAIDPAARHLGLTWGMEQGPNASEFPAGCSLVEFRVFDAEDGCRVAVRHSRLPTAQAAEENEQGWRFHLSRMAVYANRTDLEAGLERSLAAWFSAWNEQDDARRREQLDRCCADDVEFRDDWASASGKDLLSLHISNCFKFMPGWKLEPTGDVRICRGEALFGWRSDGPDGAAMEGHNHVVAKHDGTMVRVTGFQTAGQPT